MLENITTEFVYHFMLVFARLGTAFGNFPGVSGFAIPMRAKLTVSLVISLILLPVVEEYLPSYSSNMSINFSFLALEILIGMIISIAAKLYFNTVHFVGQVLSMQSGLAMANFYDPNQRTQVALFSNFMLLVATVFIFASDIHHLYIDAIDNSYRKFPPGEYLNAGDISSFVSQVFNDSFVLGFKIVSPFLVVSLAIMTGSGLLARLMPNLQVFFVISPAQIIIVMATMYVVIFPIVSKVATAVIESINILGY